MPLPRLRIRTLMIAVAGAAVMCAFPVATILLLGSGVVLLLVLVAAGVVVALGMIPIILVVLLFRPYGRRPGIREFSGPE